MESKSNQSYPIPAVRAIIENKEGKILILKRANTSFGLGKWCLPGGKVDYGQTIEASLAAELREELSIKLILAEFIFFQDSLPHEPGDLHCINFYFLCRTSGVVTLNNESSGYAWIDNSDVKNYTIVFRHDDAIRRYFSERQER